MGFPFRRSSGHHLGGPSPRSIRDGSGALPCMHCKAGLGCSGPTRLSINGSSTFVRTTCSKPNHESHWSGSLISCRRYQEHPDAPSFSLRAADTQPSHEQEPEQGCKVVLCQGGIIVDALRAARLGRRCGMSMRRGCNVDAGKRKAPTGQEGAVQGGLTLLT